MDKVSNERRYAMTSSQSTDDLVKLLRDIENEDITGSDRFYLGNAAAGTIERLLRELEIKAIVNKSLAGANINLYRKIAARDKTIETLREDAERYRWLKSQPMTDGWALVSLEIMDINEDGPTGVFYSHDGADLDAAIDAARSEEKP